MIKIIIILFFFVTSNAFSQYDTIFSIPKDTSYTANGAYNKYKKDYPFIKKVRFDEQKSNLYKKNVPYISYGNRTLSLDIFSTPDNTEIKKPAVIMMHGGGWRSGDRSLIYPLAYYISQHGYIALTIEYRLSPEAKYPAAVDDINSALQWVRQNARENGIDLNKFALLGCSSGAQMAGLIGLKYGSYQDSAGKKQKLIKAIVNIDGIMDFTSAEARKYEDDPSKKITSAGAWFGGSFNEKPELWKDASPIYYVTENSPPILFINSSMDRFHIGRDEIIKSYEKYSIYYDVKSFNDAPHSFWLFEPWFENTGAYTVEFLDKVFKTTNK